MKILVTIFLLIANAQVNVFGAETSEKQKSDELYKWVVFVHNRVNSAWIKPPSMPKTYDCNVKVKLNTSGAVESAEIVKSCENELLDKSILDAIWNVSPLPVPSDPAVLEKGIIFRFVPE